MILALFVFTVWILAAVVVPSLLCVFLLFQIAKKMGLATSMLIGLILWGMIATLGAPYWDVQVGHVEIPVQGWFVLCFLNSVASVVFSSVLFLKLSRNRNGDDSAEFD